MRAAMPLASLMAVTSIFAPIGRAVAQPDESPSDYAVMEREANNTECETPRCGGADADRVDSHMTDGFRAPAAVNSPIVLASAHFRFNLHGENSGDVAPLYHGPYKGLRVRLSGAETFHYIRSDIFNANGGVQGVLHATNFGPFPTNSTVKVLRGAVYYVLWLCQNTPRQSQIMVKDDATQEETVLRCQ